jgi:hypothetical protein
MTEIQELRRELHRALSEWRDAGGHVEVATDYIEALISAKVHEIVTEQLAAIVMELCEELGPSQPPATQRAIRRLAGRAAAIARNEANAPNPEGHCECPMCNGSGSIGIPGGPCPFCRLVSNPRSCF